MVTKIFSIFGTFSKYDTLALFLLRNNFKQIIFGLNLNNIGLLYIEAKFYYIAYTPFSPSR